MTAQHPQTTLRDLIQQAADTRQLSGRALADLAQQQGFQIAHATVNAIRSGSYKSRPSDDTIRAIAWLAGTSDRVAYEAAGQRPPRRPFADDLPPGVDTLEDRERRAAVAILSALVAQQARIDEARTPASGLHLIDPADTQAARTGRTRGSIRSEELDRWDGIDDPGPDEGV